MAFRVPQTLTVPPGPKRTQGTISLLWSLKIPQGAFCNPHHSWPLGKRPHFLTMAVASGGRRVGPSSVTSVTLFRVIQKASDRRMSPNTCSSQAPYLNFIVWEFVLVVDTTKWLCKYLFDQRKRHWNCKVEGGRSESSF